MKYIVFFVLVLAVWQTSSNAFIGGSVDVKKNIVAIHADASDGDTASYMQDATCFNSPQLPYLPDAELANTNGQIHLLTSMRIQRSNIAEYLFSLKDWVAQLSQYEASLSLHREKLHDASAYYRCQPVCEYYIFALRRILI